MDFVLDGDHVLPFPTRGWSPPFVNFRANSGPCLLWPNGSVDQDGTSHGGGPRYTPHCARWGPKYRPPKGAESPLNLRPIFYCGQTAEYINMPHGMGVDLSPGDFALDAEPAPPLKNGAQSPAQFSANVYCGQNCKHSNCWTAKLAYSKTKVKI